MYLVCTPSQEFNKTVPDRAVQENVAMAASCSKNIGKQAEENSKGLCRC